MFSGCFVNNKKVIISSGWGSARLSFLGGRWPLILLLISFFGAGQTLFSQEVATFDFPSTDRPEELPVGVKDWPKESSNGLLRIEIPLSPVNDEGALLVTVIFQDEESRIIQTKWVDAELNTTNIVDNLSENINGLNQRTFELGYQLLSQAGSLVFETEAETQPIKRIVLSWMWPSGLFTSPSTQQIKYVAAGQRLYTEQELVPDREGAVADSWSAGIWKAFLQEKVETLEEPIQFSVPMDTVPGTVIFRTKALGFPLNASASLWVNGREVKPLVFETPELAGTGYYHGAGGQLEYAGWREAAVVIPSDYLVAGNNAIVLDARKGAYLKESLLELNFEKEGAPLTLIPTASPDTSAVNVPVRTETATSRERGSPGNGPLVVVVPPPANEPPASLPGLTKLSSFSEIPPPPTEGPSVVVAPPESL